MATHYQIQKTLFFLHLRFESFPNPKDSTAFNVSPTFNVSLVGWPKFRASK